MPEITAQLSTALAGRYQVERHVGEGGMATVYLVEDLKHHRQVAVKVAVSSRWTRRTPVEWNQSGQYGCTL